MKIIEGEFEKFGDQLDMFSKNKEDTFEFEIVSTKKHENLKLTWNQLVTIIDSLEFTKKYLQQYLQEGEKTNAISEAKTKLHIENMEIISTYIQNVCKYDFENAVNKCINRRAKQRTDEDESGMETFGWMNT